MASDAKYCGVMVMWYFIRRRWFLSIRCIHLRLRWKLPDRLLPWRKLWSDILAWPTYRSQNLLYPSPGVCPKELIDQPKECQRNNTILQWLVQACPLELRQAAIDAGFSEETYFQLLDLRTKSCEQVLRITQILDRNMAAFGNVEFTALIQGLRVRNDGNSYNAPRTEPIFEEARETIILHHTCRS